VFGHKGGEKGVGGIGRQNYAGEGWEKHWPKGLQRKIGQMGGSTKVYIEKSVPGSGTGEDRKETR